MRKTARLAAAVLAALAGTLPLNAAQIPAAVTITLAAGAPPAVEAFDRSAPVLAALLGPEISPQVQPSAIRFLGSEQPLSDSQRRVLLEGLEAVWGKGRVAFETTSGHPLAMGVSPEAGSPSLFYGQDLASTIMDSFFPSSFLAGVHGRHYDGSVPATGLSVSPSFGQKPVAAAVLVTLAAPKPEPPAKAPKAAAPRANALPIWRGGRRGSAVDAAPEPPAPEPSWVADVSYGRQIMDAAAEFGVDPEVLRAVIEAKSGFHRGRVSGGAHGLMGISPATARALARRLGYDPSTVDLSDPATNIRIGAAVLAGLIRRFGGAGNPENLSRALAAYQVGAQAVIESGGIPKDRFVREFLEDFELAYRGAAPRKPPVVRVDPPPSPNLRKAREKAVETVDPSPADGSWSRVVRWYPLLRKSIRKYRLDLKLKQALPSVEAEKFFAAKIQAESSGDPNSVGTKGDSGLLQLMPETARMLGVKDPKDPAQNIDGATRHFAYLIGLFDNPVLAEAAYNAGEGRVQRAGDKVPAAAQKHVRRVFRFYRELGGEAIDLEPYMAAARRTKA